MDVLARLLLVTVLLCGSAASAQTTITIPQDPAIGALQQQIAPLQQQLQTFQAQVQTLTAQVQALQAPAESPAFLAALAKWKQNMLTFAAPVAALLADPAQPALTKQEMVYYDGTWVFLQIEDFTKDPAWHVAATNAHAAYRSYLDPNGAKAAGYNLFPHGLHLIGDDTTLKLMAVGSAFAPSYPLDWTVSADYSREVAYNVMTKIMAESLGQPTWGLAEQASQMFAHVAQWTQILNGQPVTGIPTGQNPPTYVRPFMAAISSYGMIEWAGNDPARLKQVTETLVPFWSLVWSHCFVAQAAVPNLGPIDTMMYTDKIAADGTGGQDPSPDLNLLIAPVMSWLYAQTHDLTWRDRHDKLFIGGVAGAYLGNGKQFNQSYQRSFQGLQWRQG